MIGYVTGITEVGPGHFQVSCSWCGDGLNLRAPSMELAAAFEDRHRLSHIDDVWLLQDLLMLRRRTEDLYELYSQE